MTLSPHQLLNGLQLRMIIALARSVRESRQRLREASAAMTRFEDAMRHGDARSRVAFGGLVRSSGPDADFLTLEPPSAVRRGERTVALGPQQYKVFEALAKHPGQLVKSNRLAELWTSNDATDHHVGMAIVKLRRQLADLDAPNVIHTVTGKGFFLSPLDKSTDPDGPRVLTFGDGGLILNTITGIAARHNKVLNLTPPLDNFLQELMRHAGDVVSRDRLASVGVGPHHDPRKIVQDMRRLARLVALDDQPPIIHREQGGFVLQVRDR